MATLTINRQSKRYLRDSVEFGLHTLWQEFRDIDLGIFREFIFHERVKLILKIVGCG